MRGTPFEFLKGRATDVVAARGIIDFTVDGRPVSLVESRFSDATPIVEGEWLSVVAAPQIHEPEMAVLAIHREGARKILYTGMRVHWSFLAIVVSLIVLEIGHEGFAMMLAVLFALPIATIQVQCALDEWRVRRFFKAHYVEPIAIPVQSADALLPIGVETTQETLALLSDGILEFTHDAIIIWEMDGAGIAYWNRAAEHLYGYSREEARGKVTHDLLKTRLAGGVSALETRVARYGVWVGELEHTARDGRQIQVEARLALMSRKGGGWVVLEVNQDITDRKRAESDRRAMAERLNDLHRKNEPPSSES